MHGGAGSGFDGAAGIGVGAAGEGERAAIGLKRAGVDETGGRRIDGEGGGIVGGDGRVAGDTHGVHAQLSAAFKVEAVEDEFVGA